MTGDFEALVDRIYDTAASPASWGSTLTEISDALSSASSVLCGISVPEQRVTWSHLGRYDPASARIFCDHHFNNPLMKVVPQRPVGEIVIPDEVLSVDHLRKSAFWGEVLQPYDIAHLAVIPVSRRSDSFAAFNIFRTPAQGPFTAHDRSAFERLTPHLRRAMQLQLRVEGYQHLVEGTLSALDQLAVGILILTNSASVAYANRKAREMHAEGGPILLHDGTVVARSAGRSAQLRRLISDSLCGGAGGAVPLSESDTRKSAVAVVAPLRGRSVHALRAEGMPTVGAVIFVSAGSASDVAPTILTQLYGFTPAETRVALHIARGESVAAIASALGLSVNTVKTHTRRIFDKAGVRRQAEFCRTLSGLQLLDVRSTA
ncbi:helix-turn-helix transcriptional regulator [Reyranella sp.]|uniref:helix-turn-helix transcriptional regulator n=1 Tax=Reyranella sp. TaxID=1929291 RepID=UPI003D0DB1FA